MDFEVGMIYGEDYNFSKNRAWPRVKLAIEHALENVPRLIVFWAFDLTEIKRTLAENRFDLAGPEDQSED